MKKLAFVLLALSMAILASCSPGGSKVVNTYKVEDYDGVQLHKVPAMRFAVVKVYDTIQNFPLHQGELVTWLVTTQAPIDGSFTGFFSSKPVDQKMKFNYMIGVPVTQKVLGSSGIRIMPTDEMDCACILHRGSYDTIGKSYDEVLRWCAVNQYETLDPYRELYISGPGPNDPVDPSKYVTEIQIPVRKRTQIR
ncbi:MAG: GyrI-like domain-containing protein [Candidatus Brocadiia bacterium]